MAAVYAVGFTVVMIALAVLLWWLNPSSAAVRVKSEFSPTNEVERLLLEAVASQEFSPELRRQLLEVSLLALENDSAPGEPMTLSAYFPPEFATSLENVKLTEDGRIQFGPYVVCFSSQAVVDGLKADRLLGPLVTQVGRPREFAAREIFQAAMRHKLDVVLNPFFGVSRRFPLDEIGELLS